MLAVLGTSKLRLVHKFWRTGSLGTSLKVIVTIKMLLCIGNGINCDENTYIYLMEQKFNDNFFFQGQAKPTCPIDRTEFTFIKVRTLENNEVLRSLPVLRPDTQNAPESQQEDFGFNILLDTIAYLDRMADVTLCQVWDHSYLFIVLFMNLFFLMSISCILHNNFFWFQNPPPPM